MSAPLTFEEPLRSLEKSIGDYRKFCREKGIDCAIADDLLDSKFPAVRTKMLSNLTAWDQVQLARHPQRPYPMDLAGEIFSDFLELHGDRRFADDRAIVGGFAKLDGRPVMLICTCKGRNLKQNIECQFGSAQPEGYRKALRLMKLADKAGCPVICLVDTPGAYPGVTAEERHIGEAIAVCIRDSFSLRVPVISVITGEGGSGGALALCTANRLLIMEYAYYSVITPEGCAAIIWRSPDETPKAAEALRLTSQDMLRLGVADAIVPEPLGGGQLDPHLVAANLKKALLEQLQQLDSIPRETLPIDRYHKFRQLGQFTGDHADTPFTIRPAQEGDISFLHAFFLPFVLRRQILPRSEEDIREHLQNFLLAVTADGKIAGTIALRDFGDGLQEIRTLAVSSKFEGRGLGSRLIQAALSLARTRSAKTIFTLTIRPQLFQRMGFHIVSMMHFPQKIQNDCLTCPKREQCDEVALALNL